MPKTIVRQQTYMCPLGIGRLGQADACRFHRAADNLPKDGKCPVHDLLLEMTTLPEDQITKTVMGEEDIEPEIAAMDADRAKKGQGGLTAQEKEAHRAKRRDDIAKAIAEARKREYKP